MRKPSVNNDLFIRLSADRNDLPEWWSNLKNDSKISIQIRKDSSIDAYFNGAAVITGLKYSNNSFTDGAIHIKYVPVTQLKKENSGNEQDDTGYVPYCIDKDSMKFPKLEPIQLNNFQKQSLKNIKDIIKKYSPNDSEKAIQYAFLNNDVSFVDSEFQYRYTWYKKKVNIRVDLIRLDVNSKKIIFVEVKKINDARLYNGEIVRQLEKYENFISKYKKELLEYYDRIVKIKHKLGLKLPDELENNPSLEGYSLVRKPLLLFGDCHQPWIRNNAERLDDEISQHAAGCYYFGRSKRAPGAGPCCDLLARTWGPRHIFGNPFV